MSGSLVAPEDGVILETSRVLGSGASIEGETDQVSEQMYI